MERVFIVSVNLSTREISYSVNANSNKVFTALITEDSIITDNNRAVTLNDITGFAIPADITLNADRNIITRLNIIQL